MSARRTLRRWHTLPQLIGAARYEWSVRKAWATRRAAVRGWWWWLVRRHAFEICQDCGRPVDQGIGGASWRTSDEIWQRVFGTSGGTLCPSCFTVRADRLGRLIYWRAQYLDEDGHA